LGARDVQFTPEQIDRLRKVCRQLGCSYSEFVSFAVMQAVGECEAIAGDYERVKAFYEGGG
jgi:hypothetical protein